MELSIIIVSYNTCNVTRRCLESVLAQTRLPDYEVIVVDNGSADGSVEMVRTEFPRVRLLCNGYNAGFARAQNAGMLASRGRHILVLNSDTVFVGDTAGALLNYLRGSPSSVAAVGPRVLNPDGSAAPSARRSLLSTPVLALGIVNRHFRIKRLLPSSSVARAPLIGKALARLHDNYARHDEARAVDYVDGMCVMFRREVLHHVGLFDEQFFFDGEILDLSNRIRGAGYAIVFFPDAKVIHLGGESRKGVSGIIVESHKSLLIYLAKYSPSRLHFIRSVTVCVVALRLLVTRLMALVSRRDDRRSAVKAYHDIIDMCRKFDRRVVRANERIPRLVP